MEYSKNPFTPTFGSVPPFLAGREHILRDINRGFINGPGDPNLSTIFTGARGTGKTALLSLLSETALEHGWIAANVSAMPGMLEDIIERTKEAADSYLSQPHARINGVQIGPVGIDWTYAQEAQGNWRTRMNGIFKQLEKHDIGLLITIDEVTVDLEEMLQFASVYQHFVREKKKLLYSWQDCPTKYRRCCVTIPSRSSGVPNIISWDESLTLKLQTHSAKPLRPEAAQSRQKRSRMP